jgi:hypothetical protein
MCSVRMSYRTDLSDFCIFFCQIFFWHRTNALWTELSGKKKVPGSFGTVMYKIFDLQSEWEGEERGTERG